MYLILMNLREEKVRTKAGYPDLQKTAEGMGAKVEASKAQKLAKVAMKPQTRAHCRRAHKQQR